MSEGILAGLLVPEMCCSVLVEKDQKASGEECEAAGAVQQAAAAAAGGTAVPYRTIITVSSPSSSTVRRRGGGGGRGVICEWFALGPWTAIASQTDGG